MSTETRESQRDANRPSLPSPQEQQAADAAARAATKAAKSAAEPALEDDSTEETDPTKYFENRVRAVQAAKAEGRNPYPHKFHASMQLPAYVAKFQTLEDGQQLTDETISVAGGWRGKGTRREMREFSSCDSRMKRRWLLTPLPRLFHASPAAQAASPARQLPARSSFSSTCGPTAPRFR